MELLWSPWRMAYVTAIGGDADCFLCAALEGDDDEAVLVVHRGESTITILNKFPYNTGHVMIAPHRHVAELSELSASERAAVMEETSRAIEAIRAAMSPHGFNVGMNLGQVAGAGVPGHVHVHVVPRWGGDTNFMPVVGQTKVLPEALADTYTNLKQAYGAT
jgi:ATP adenylyltransferase